MVLAAKQSLAQFDSSNYGLLLIPNSVNDLKHHIYNIHLIYQTRVISLTRDKNSGFWTQSPIPFRTLRDKILHAKILLIYRILFFQK